MPERAAVMTGPDEPIEVRSFDEADLRPGEVRLEIVASEVCGTDVHLRHGRLAGVPYPIIPGHVSVGRVVELRDVERDAAGHPLTEGDVVTFYDVVGTCHRCYHCTVAGQPNLCAQRRVYGITFPLEAGLKGGWATSMCLEPGTSIFRLPDGLSPADVIGGGCGLFTGFGAVERGGLRLGDAVVVQGSGPVGLAAAAFARIGGCGPLVVIGDPADRLRLATAMGADVTLSVADDPPEARAEAVRALTAGRGADLVIEASGNASAVPEGFELLRSGGTYVIAGHYTDAGPVKINAHTDINRKHAEVRGRWGTEERHVARSLELLARYAPPFGDVIGGEYPLEQAGLALSDVADLRVTKAIIAPGAGSGRGPEAG